MKLNELKKCREKEKRQQKNDEIIGTYFYLRMHFIGDQSVQRNTRYFWTSTSP